VEKAVKHGLRETPVLQFPQFAASSDAVQAVLELLANVSVEQGTRLLEPYLGETSSRGLDALWLATRLQMPEARETALALIGSSQAHVRRYAFGSLLLFGDCRDLQTVATTASTDPGIMVALIPPFLDYARSCGAYDELLGPLGRSEDPGYRQAVFRSLYSADPGRALSQAEDFLRPRLTASRVVRSLPEEYLVLRGLRGLPESHAAPLLLPRLQHPDDAVRVGAAALLAEWGRREALDPLLEVALDGGLPGPTREDAVEALRWFSGPPVVEVLDSILASDPPLRIRHSVYLALSGADPSVAVPRLLEGLRDPAESARGVARDALTSLPPEESVPLLQVALESLEEDGRLSVALALQARTGRSFDQLFRDYLEREREEPDEQTLIREAMAGLQEAYLGLPASEALQALGSPSRDVRFAAMMALAEHPDEVGANELLASILQDPSDDRQTTAKTTLWAIRFMERLHGILDMGYDAVDRGETFRWPMYGYRANNGSVLAPWRIPNYYLNGWMALWPARHFVRSWELTFAGELMEGHAWDVELWGELWGHLTRRPQRAAEILQMEPFETLQDYYAFRVLTGLQDPVLVDAVASSPTARD
jgi:HEAT repeat protein